MKLFCLIISVYVIVLSTNPCCADNDCKDTEISKKELAGNTPVKEKDCRGCSPFFTCCTYIGFVVTKPVIPNLKPFTETTAKIYFAYEHLFTEQVSLSIWQPPQLS